MPAGVSALLGLRTVLLPVLGALLLWLAARVLRESLLGRVGQLAKLLVFGAAFGFYVLTVVLTVMGGAPWGRWLALPQLSVRTLVIAAFLLVGWLVLRPGGVLAISEVLIDPHYRTRSDVRRLARQAGFEPVAVEGSWFCCTATFRRPMPKEPLGCVPRFG